MPQRVSISAATLPTPPMPTIATWVCWQASDRASVNIPEDIMQSLACKRPQPVAHSNMPSAVLIDLMRQRRAAHRLVADALVVLHDAHALQRHQAAVRVGVYHLQRHPR